jgi:toxin HigB-1
MNQVSFTPKALKQLKNLPLYIYQQVRFWSESVERHGIQTVRQVKGYRDHPLKGEREGQRSVSLNRSWRLIYTEALTVLAVQEVTHHDYRTP